MSRGEAPVYRFGVFEVDSRSGELLKHGRRLRLRGRPIDILLILIETPGEVVTRDELRTRLWPADTFVDFDHGVNSAVNRLREALGDSADNPRFIETLPKRGYRFIAPVTAGADAGSTVPASATVSPTDHTTPPTSHTHSAPVSAGATVAAEPPPRIAAAPIATPPITEVATRRRWRPAGVIALTILALVVAAGIFTLVRPRASAPSTLAKMTIAVLPFTNLSGDAGQEYFSDGFTEEMIATLGALEPDRLAVIGRTTSMLYKGAKKSIGQIGQELGVTYLLEGSIRRSGPRVRITAQLVDTRDMTHLWSDSYERDVVDVLAIQTDVARQIARSLALALAPTPARDVSGPRSFTAYELWMRGRFYREQATEAGARQAIQQYEAAIAADPMFAAAHAGIADAYRLLGAPGWEVDAPMRLLPKAKAAAERALALDGRSAEARAVLAMIKLNYDWDLDGAEREIQESLRINPSFAQAHQYYSGILTPMGRPEEAIAAARRAMALDPLAPTASTSLGVRYLYANRPADAQAQFLQTLELTPGFAVAHWGLALCYRSQGRLAEHLDQLRSAVQLSGNSSYMRAQLAYGYAAAGDRAAAAAIRKELIAEGQKGYTSPYHLALIAAGLKETEGAVMWLERAFADRSGWLVFLKVQPEFDAMRQAPAFQRLLARVGPQR